MVTDDIAAAFRQALNRELLGIEQIDAELAEDGQSVLSCSRSLGQDLA
ncbi:hypothetical protein Q4543_24375 [Salipiger sp. 1_MG-2023]|nr:hypothetical protein [Salipiger sp. 1_MG-2023]MDO6588580.1 hypothetical protein [Salipiger sp. 1_MG-2023]